MARNCIIKRDEKGNVKVYNSILMKKAEQERLNFQIIGEKGARNLDQVEEATFRMDNLRVAKEMEQAGKTPKEIRLATGWEKSGIENIFTSLSAEQKISFLLEKGDLKIEEC